MTKKIKDLFIYISLFIVAFFSIRFDYFNLDVSWEMNFGLNILEGNLPYKDFAIVVTPFYPFVTSFFMLLFKNSYGYFLAQTFIIIFHIFILNLFFKKYAKNNQYIYILPLFFLILKFQVSYNFLIISLANLMIYFLIKYFEDDKKINLNISGFIAALIVLTKQSTGCMIILIVYSYVFYLFIKNKKIKNIFHITISFLAVMVIFLMYLVLTNNFYNFIDYTVLGLSQFKDKNHTTFALFFSNWAKPVLFIVFIAILVFNIYFGIKLKRKEISFLILAAIGNAFCMIPIVNLYHICCSIVGFVIPSILILDNYINFDLKEKYKKVFVLFMFCALILKVCSSFVYAESNFVKYNNGYLRNVYLEEKTFNEINDINEYIHSHENFTYITPEEIAVIAKMADGKVASKPLDIFNYGNLGIKTPIQTIKEIDDSFYIYIYKPNIERILPQTPLEAIDYIRNNYELIDTTKYFEIYKKQ